MDVHIRKIEMDINENPIVCAGCAVVLTSGLIILSCSSGRTPNVLIFQFLSKTYSGIDFCFLIDYCNAVNYQEIKPVPG